MTRRMICWCLGLSIALCFQTGFAQNEPPPFDVNKSYGPSSENVEPPAPYVEPQAEPAIQMPQGYLVILEPYRRTLLFAEVNSPVTQITKRMGESFKEHDVLLRLDDDIFISNLGKAEAVLKKQEAALEAKKQLYRDKVISLFELRESEADVAAANSELALAKRNLQATTIKAPYDGKVVELSIEIAELPRPGKEMIELADEHIVMARFLVPGTELHNLNIGKPVYITMQETGEEITAKITRLGAVIDPSSSLIRVEAEIDNKDGKLIPGMIGNASFIPPEERRQAELKPHAESKPQEYKPAEPFPNKTQDLNDLQNSHDKQF